MAAFVVKKNAPALNPGYPTEGIDLKEYGVSGTKILAGLVYEEINPKLAGYQGYQTFHEMRFDATCAALLGAIKLPIRSARWFVEPATQEEKDIEKADFVHDNFYTFGSQSMDDILRLALSCLDFGFSWMEIVWAMIEAGQWTGKVGWDKFAWRSQATKWRWNMGMVEGRQELLSATQLAPPFYQQVDIPRDKLMIFVHNQEGDNFDGWSMLRPAWKNYFIRDMLYRIQAIGLERGYMGIPVATTATGFSNEMTALAKQIVTTLRLDEQAGVVKPEEIALEILHNSIQGDAMQKAIEHHDTQIVAQGLADFLKLGTKDVGSFALSSDKSELFLMALNAVANYTGEQFNLEPAIPKLIRANFADSDDFAMPKLLHGDVGQRSLDKLGRTLDALAKNGFLTPDDATEDKLREMLELPERDQDLKDRDLLDIVQQVLPTQPDWRLPKPESARLRPNTLIVPGSAAALPPAKAGPAKAPKTAQDTMGPGEFAERIAQVAAFREYAGDLLVRKPWSRPRHRLDDRTRTRIRMSEMLIDAMQDFTPNQNGKPQRPSERSRHIPRRPVEIYSEKPAKRRGKMTTVPRHAVVAKRRAKPIQGLFRDLGKK